MFVYWKSSLFKGLDPIDHLTLPQLSCLFQARTYIIWSLKGVWWIGQVINSCYNQLECPWWWINFSFWKTFLVMKKTTSFSVQLTVTFTLHFLWYYATLSWLFLFFPISFLCHTSHTIWNWRNIFFYVDQIFRLPWKHKLNYIMSLICTTKLPRYS